VRTTVAGAAAEVVGTATLCRPLGAPAAGVRRRSASRRPPTVAVARARSAVAATGAGIPVSGVSRWPAWSCRRRSRPS